MHFDQHVHAEASAASSIACAAASSTAAMMIRMQSAPRRALRPPDRDRSMKSLRSAGRAVASRAAVEEFRPALERGRVGEHRQAGRAAGLIGPGQRRRIEIGADQALRRARLLDLGDQRVVAAGDAALDRARRSRAAARRALASASSVGERARALGGGDLLALVGFDLARECRVMLASARSTPRSAGRARPSAAPLSIDLAASAAPSFRSLALPATISAAAALSSATSRKAPGLPLSTSSSALALCAASPPRSASGLARGRPASSGVISKVRTLPFSSAATLVGPDGGDLVEAVGAVHHPGALGAEIAQHLRHRLDPVLARTRRPSGA